MANLKTLKALLESKSEDILITEEEFETRKMEAQDAMAEIIQDQEQRWGEYGN
jgi:hypothetical protein